MLPIGICSRTSFNGVSENQNLIEDFIKKLLTINIRDLPRLGHPFLNFSTLRQLLSVGAFLRSLEAFKPKRPVLLWSIPCPP